LRKMLTYSRVNTHDDVDENSYEENKLPVSNNACNRRQQLVVLLIALSCIGLGYFAHDSIAAFTGSLTSSTQAKLRDSSEINGSSQSNTNSFDGDMGIKGEMQGNNIQEEESLEDESTSDGSNPAMTTKQQQIRNFALGQRSNHSYYGAIVASVHITHHAGTAVCGAFKAAGFHSPSFACMSSGGTNPIGANQTETMIRSLLRQYDFISWEYGKSKRDSHLDQTHWENPHLVSLIVMRHPIDRSLAGDGFVNKNYGEELNRSPELWWDFANSYATNNFALQKLVGKECCDGKDTDPTFLLKAKELLSRFTFIVDQECLGDGILQVAKTLNFTQEQVQAIHHWADQSDKKYINNDKHKATARERINNDTIYEFLLERGQLDIELYEWSKTLSIVNCSEVNGKDNEM